MATMVALVGALILAGGVSASSPADPIAVTMDLAPAPIAEANSTLAVTLTANWPLVGAADVALELPAGLSTTVPLERSLELPMGVPVVFTVPIEAAEGTHRIEVSALATTDMFAEEDKVTAARVAHVVVPDDGAGEFHLDLLPFPEHPRIVPVERIDPDQRSTGVASDITPRMPSESASLTLADLPPRFFDTPLDEEASHDHGSNGAESGSSTFQMRFCWFYEREDGNSDLFQRDALIQFWDYDGTVNPPQLLDQGFAANHDGCFISAPVDRHEGDDHNHVDPFVRVLLCHQEVCVRDADGDAYQFTGDWQTVGDEALLDFGNGKADCCQIAQRQFQYGSNMWRFTIGPGGIPIHERGGVDIYTPSDGCNTGGMCYQRDDDRIHVPAGGDRSPDDLGHEYGHYVQDKLYGDSYWPSPNGAHGFCVNSVDTDGIQDRGLAWAEGLANWFGPVANNVMAGFVGANGANGDTLYSRPWNGDRFTRNMETTRCADRTLGFANEWPVATALWDLFDEGPGDGVSVSVGGILTAVDACNDAHFGDFYDGRGPPSTQVPRSLSCNWDETGGHPCDFVTAAFPNDINFNRRPIAEMSSFRSFQWVSGIVGFSGFADDPERCRLTGEFRVSTNANCTTEDSVIGGGDRDLSARFNTRSTPDGADRWMCIRAHDGLQWGPFDVSDSHVTVDNTRPSPTVTLDPPDPSGERGWYVTPVEIISDCTDDTSGYQLGSLRARVDPDHFAAIEPGESIFLSDSGERQYDLTCRDNAENLGRLSTTVRIDRSVPTTSFGVEPPDGDNGWHRSKPQVFVHCHDTFSGCYSTTLIINDGSERVHYSDRYQVPGSSLRAGTNTLKAWSVDWAGNEEPDPSITVRIDGDAPVTTLSIDRSFAPATVTLSCSDGDVPHEVSGCRKTSFSVGFRASQTYEGPFQLGFGRHTVCIGSQDRAGNLEESHCSTFRINPSPLAWTFRSISHGEFPTYHVALQEVSGEDGGSDGPRDEGGDGSSGSTSSSPGTDDSRLHVAAGECVLWASDAQARTDVAFSEGPWPIELVGSAADPSPTDASHELLIGIVDGGLFSEVSRNLFEFLFDQGTLAASFDAYVPQFVVPAGSYLGFSLCNTSEASFELEGNGQSTGMAPAESDPFPTPELPTIVLAAIGVALFATAARAGGRKP